MLHKRMEQNFHSTFFFHNVHALDAHVSIFQVSWSIQQIMKVKYKHESMFARMDFNVSI